MWGQNITDYLILQKYKHFFLASASARTSSSRTDLTTTPPPPFFLPPPQNIPLSIYLLGTYTYLPTYLYL